MSQIDLDAAEHFLALLGGREPFTFQTFDDTEKRRAHLLRIAHGSLREHAAKFEQLNSNGAGIFYMPAQGDLKGRKAANVLRVRAVFVDLDGAPLDPVSSAPIKPAITVQSSPGKYHAYWPIDGLPLRHFAAVQAALAQRFDSDPSVKDLPRVMRLPGFLHRKGDPYLTNVIEAREERPIPHREFLDAFDIDPNAITDWKGARGPIPEGQRNSTLFSMARGFVGKGMEEQAILARLRKTNAERCAPPLPDDELAVLVHRAIGYGANGAISIPYHHTDRADWRALTPSARDLYGIALRKSAGAANASTSLRAHDLATWGFGNARTLAKYRQELIDAGFMEVTRQHGGGIAGEPRICGLYRPIIKGRV